VEGLPDSATEALASGEDELLELDQDCTVTRYPDAAAGRRPLGVPGGGHAETALRTAGRAPRAPREV
jgi:HEPN domain-containing protein